MLEMQQVSQEIENILTEFNLQA